MPPLLGLSAALPLAGFNLNLKALGVQEVLKKYLSSDYAVRSPLT